MSDQNEIMAVRPGDRLIRLSAARGARWPDVVRVAGFIKPLSPGDKMLVTLAIEERGVALFSPQDRLVLSEAVVPQFYKLAPA